VHIVEVATVVFSDVELLVVEIILLEVEDEADTFVDIVLKGQVQSGSVKPYTY